MDQNNFYVSVQPFRPRRIVRLTTPRINKIQKQVTMYTLRPNVAQFQ